MSSEKPESTPTTPTNPRRPVLALRNLVVFPGLSVPIRVGRAQSLAALREARNGSGPAQILATLQTHPDAQIDRVQPSDLNEIGVLCEIEKVRGNENEGLQLILKGVTRVRLKDAGDNGEFLEANYEAWPDQAESTPEAAASGESLERLFMTLKEAAKDLAQHLPQGADQVAQVVENIEDLSFLTYIIAANLDLPIDDKQKHLAERSVRARAERMLEAMTRIKAELQVKTEIRDKLTNKLGKNQRDAILREQMRAIKEELGEAEGESDKADDYKRRIEESAMPDDVKKIARDEVKRLEALSNQSPETHVIRNYLDLLLALPWKIEDKETPDFDLKTARASLDADHFGLDKVKKRIIEHLATLKLRGGQRGMILLLIGPPGVGKTSLGSSIAKAMNRKFVRAALGGVRDDAEVRGHRRTYVGAMPGRIIQGIKRAGVMNPVFLLDEIDKLSRGFSGDPAAALLEVLDPEQNSSFHDHYLDVPYDLSKVMFIATANSLEGIPGPLLDRMEVIDLSGYTSAEKLHIARNHLLPKQMEEHGLKAEQVEIRDEVLQHIIHRHTREAGVRSLQRQLASLCRNLAARVVEQESGGVVSATLDMVDEALGAPRFEHEETNRFAPAGVVTGLAWTPVGGEILFVEATSMPGSGKLTLTGQLGDVMKESAQIALSLIRSRLPHIAEKVDFEKRDFHVHVPAGAIPKDGPSAGVAMVTALASLMTGKTVDTKVAMTGEVTLRGKVTPVGGVKEKIMGAHRAGVKTVLIPRKNERDLKDVPPEVLENVRVELMDDVADVLRVALGLELPAQDQATGLWGAFAPPAARTPPSSASNPGSRAD